MALRPPAGAHSKRTASKPNRAKNADSLVTGSIVAIDDDPITLRLLSAHLRKAGYSIQTAESGALGLELVDDYTSVALIDLRMPDLTGFQVLQHLQENHPAVEVIVLTGSEDVSDAVKAMREGAFRYITKPFDPDELVINVEKAIASWKIADENKNLKATHRQYVPVRDMDSTGDVQDRLLEQVTQIAALDSTVFIGGETGTGKSTIARLIHQKSDRAKEPFVTVNCASLPRDLIQSELFGHVKGSFTGAVNDRIGHAEAADGGTLFLDEIGDLPLDLQPKLLSFLQERTVQRLGDTQSRQVDVRLIAATHRDLALMCRNGLFRQDLYFRLMVLNLELPAIRDRMAEFNKISESILKSICERQSIPVKSISSESMQALMSHSWPGNLRELENVLERAVAYSKSPSIEPHDLIFSKVSLDTPAEAIENDATESFDSSPINGDSVNGNELSASIDKPAEQSEHYQLAGKTLEQIERDAILQTLEMLNGNKAKSARTLGISEKSIYNKMRRLKIERET